MLKSLTFATAIAPTLFVPLSAQTVLLAGREDGFACPADPASPSAALQALQCGAAPGAPWQHFDAGHQSCGGAANTSVGHTFSLPAGISAGTLEMRLRAASWPGVDTDGLILSFATPATVEFPEATVYVRSFGPNAGGCAIPPDPYGLLGSWNPGQEATLTLDLTRLPLPRGGTCNILPELNTHGFLDVTVSDETIVDYFKLTLSTGGPPCPGRHVSYGTGSPGTAGLTPELTGLCCPTPGSALGLRISRALGGAPAALLVGTASTSAPLFGATLLVVPTAVVPLQLRGSSQVPRVGTATLTLLLPPTTPPADLYWQCVVVDPASTHGLAFTNGVQSSVR